MSIKPYNFFQYLSKNKINFFTGVPDSLLKQFCLCVDHNVEKNKHIITFNQWFDESLVDEKNLQPIYYPSINKKNLDSFNKKFINTYNEKPNHLMLLSYDLVGLIYYLSIKNDISQIDDLFKKKNSFKGKIGIFDIQDNKINHRLSFYQIEEGKLKEIF